MKIWIKAYLIIGQILLILSSCQNKCSESAGTSSLKEAFNKHFLMGTALSQKQILGKDPESVQIALNHFNALTAENDMKWERIHPELNQYNFEVADKFVELGQHNDMFLVGHTLVWHSQTPQWVFEDNFGQPLSRDSLLSRMKDHIFTIVGRYKGRVHGWDVVNEAFEDDGSLRQSPWLKIIGKDYFEKAFEYAHEADPEAELYYNDYSMANPGRRDAVARAIDSLRKKGVRIDGIGMQLHAGLNYPALDELDKAILTYSKTGAQVMITELDVSILPNPYDEGAADITMRFELTEKMNPYAMGIPDSAKVVLANRYADLFNVFAKHHNVISRVTLWGVNDGQSWKNNFPIKGRYDYPLLFDRNNKPKIAVDTIIKNVKNSRLGFGD